MTSSRPVTIFNTPYECALRAGALLMYAHPIGLDLQRLVYLDYLLVHSGDADGPASLHAAMPQRTAEWTVRRERVKSGVHALACRRLAAVSYRQDGIHYVATESLAPVMRSFTTSYALGVLQRAKWATRTYLTVPEEELATLTRNNVTNWGGEFSFEAREWEGSGD